MTDRIGAGFRLVLRGFFNSSGVFLGGTTTAPTAGAAAGSPMLRLQGGRVLPLQAQEPDIVPADGDDETKVTFEFDPSGLPSGNLELTTRDDAFEALVQGTKVWVGDTNIRVGVYEPLDRASEQVCLLATRRAKDWTAGSRGVAKYQHLLIPQCNMKPLGNQYEQRAYNGYNYSINVSKGDKLPWTSVNDGEHGTTGGGMFPIESNYPLMIQRWTGNAALQTFTMTHVRETSGSMVVFTDDVQQAETTDWTCADEASSLVFTGTPGSGAVIVAVWEYPEADIT